MACSDVTKTHFFFQNLFKGISMKLAQSMSNSCRIRYPKFRVDICNGFGVIAKIREGGRFCPPPSGARVNWSSPAILSVLTRHLNGISHNTDDWKLRPPDVSPLLYQEMPIILVRLVIRKSHLLQVSWPVHFFFEDLDVKSVKIFEN